MVFQTVQRAFESGDILKWDVPALTEALQATSQQPPHVDFRHAQIVSLIHNLINERQNRSRHQISTQQAKDFHDDSQAQTTKINAELTKVKDQIVEIKTTLKETHSIHLWILAVAIVTAILALIAALDVVLKWFPSTTTAPASESMPPPSQHNTNK